MNYDSIIFQTHSKLSTFFTKKYAICTNSYKSTLISALLSLNLQNKYILVNSQYIADIVSSIHYEPVIINDINDINDIVKKIRNYQSYCFIVSHNNQFNLDKLYHICLKHNIFIIDDFRKKYNKKVKMIGELSCFCLEKNSYINAEEGGFILTDIEKFSNVLLSLSGYIDNPLIYNYSYRITKMQCLFILNYIVNIT